ncbi:hypothetical protein [Pseudoalteromonas luteoviolacea]|uniref:Uncharacterized protein n=1 Tax=Pseudoalteromonas luteoviolacea S4054 TaxID=1129367 RepID=A0A0F6AHW8_9GAMM|nr:hypothetical protein [Pseudoalteromonas luteoviolacea]AOT07943.1 hypothetical protein S4054249_08840 [Pseudoalteromonas luteoviolacea]AOT12859.1 hypothetical protein S40542_08840 [Pseudoalteromonas luteoviolacea]AOT17772.1 hypothetical protein S4054_08835 [Pseudoalteromonas luteoviolacea]KKE85815.1 hypothetical protein N479_00145 [Pseudoalteromonas luteoviolacea S4054]KZN74693.1 hypothetical protein N481_08525 [Pseudoalteromonas luteoviolacea S4047-1]
MKNTKKLMAAVALLSTFYAVAADQTYTAYGYSKGQAQAYIGYYAKWKNLTVVSMSCYQRTLQPSWRCDATLR